METGNFGHSEGFMKRVLQKFDAPYEPGPFSTFILRDSSPGNMCRYLSPHIPWTLLNVAKEKVPEFKLDYWVRSTAALTGCYIMTAPRNCKVTSKRHATETASGKKMSVFKMTSYDCPAKPGVTNFGAFAFVVSHSSFVLF